MTIPYPEIRGVQFTDVAGFPGYCVGDDGSMWSRRATNGRGSVSRKYKMLKPVLKKNGRYQVALRRDGKTCWRDVHRLVLEAFIGPCPPGLEACHEDDVHSHNNLSNLRWDTHVNNCLERSQNGIHVGEAHPNSKLNNESIKRLWKLRENGYSCRAISRELNVSSGTVYQVLCGKTWRSIGEET